MNSHSDTHDAERHACCPAKKIPWYFDKTFLVCTTLAALLAISQAWAPLASFRRVFLDYLRMIGLSVLLGFFFGGVIDRYIPREYVSRILAQKKKRTIFSSVLLGFLMSACSHGMLALAVELYRKGASTAVVVSFLLASPWANLPVTFLLFGFFGFKALLIILGALLIAVVTGLIFQLLERKHWVESNPRTISVEPGFSIRKDILRRIRASRFTANQFSQDARSILDSAVTLARMTLWWILIGIGFSALAGAFIPSEFFRQYMGPTALGLCATLALATLLEVCSEGTAPVAFEIFKQTGAFGNSFVFLMAGVVTDYTEIGLLWTNIGKKTALWLPLVAVPQVVLLGLLFNRLF